MDVWYIANARIFGVLVTDRAYLIAAFFIISNYILITSEEEKLFSAT